ncbi:hypothetical protein AB0I68_38200 [Streptomyces sp. NPDC050448]|uniref:hypothetical protein n=1 Tax=Streptomyces sp. NPDC050448 TaxID=3155404 RepID=UPI0034249D42
MAANHLQGDALRRFGQLPSLLAAVLVATGFALVPAAQAATVAPATNSAAVRPSDDSGPAVHHDTSPPLRTLHAAPVSKPGPRPVREVPNPSAAKVTDPVVQKSHRARAAAVPTIVNFDGIGAESNEEPLVPPDPNASVGATQVVETVNLAFAVYSKTGSTILPPTPTNALWDAFGGPCENTSAGDAVVRWDNLAQRWVITQLAGTLEGPFVQCVAVSTSPDATGTYSRYSFVYADLNDYPKLSVWPDAYYLTFDRFNPSNGNFLGAEVCALDRAQMLDGSLATQQCFYTDPGHGSLLGADLDGSTPPPAGAPNLLMGLNGTSNNSLAYWKFHVDWANPGNSTFTGPGTLPVAPFTIACPNAGPDTACIPQGGTSQQLESLSDRLMYRLAYRNFGTHESLVVNHSVDVGGSAAVRWYELRLSGGNPVVHQQGTYAPDATFRWMGSIAQDRVGNIAVGYSQSSAASYPSIRVAGRRASDPLGTLTTGETTLVNGGGSQFDDFPEAAFRWGDYTSMAVDPSDDCTLWYTNQYQPANGLGNWHTRIASFVLPGCLTHQTKLGATPAYVKKYPHPRLVPPYPTATLTDVDTGRPLSGQRLTFTAGSKVLCIVTTDRRGRATCKPKDGVQSIINSHGYIVTYRGDQTHQSATARGRLVIVGKQHDGKQRHGE